MTRTTTIRMITVTMPMTTTNNEQQANIILKPTLVALNFYLVSTAFAYVLTVFYDCALIVVLMVMIVFLVIVMIIVMVIVLLLKVVLMVIPLFKEQMAFMIVKSIDDNKNISSQMALRSHCYRFPAKACYGRIHPACLAGVCEH